MFTINTHNDKKRLFLCNVSDTGKQNLCLDNKPTCWLQGVHSNEGLEVYTLGVTEKGICSLLSKILPLSNEYTLKENFKDWVCFKFNVDDTHAW